ncbi:MAG: hypothetical protein GYB65_15360 [Chloroflexi bacterium]|nr:hypothetical protein [Chloroflexota bacterium]
MSPVYLAVPNHNQLENRANWINSGDQYYVVRYHFAIQERQLPSPTRMGEVTDVYSVNPNVKISDKQKVRIEHTATSYESELSKALAENKFLNNLSVSLEGHLGLGAVAGASSDVTSSLGSSLSQSLSREFSVQFSTTVTRTEETERQIDISPESSSDHTIVAVKVYKQYCLDVFLVFVDYLFVEYRKRVGALGRKRYDRIKLPESPVNQYDHRNLLAVRKHVMSIHFWKPLPNPLLINEKDHKLEVDDPSQTEVIAPDPPRPCHKSVELPKPTLYELSNKAFPTR